MGWILKMIEFRWVELKKLFSVGDYPLIFDGDFGGLIGGPSSNCPIKVVFFGAQSFGSPMGRWCEGLNGVNRFSNLSRMIGALSFGHSPWNLERNFRWNINEMIFCCQLPQKIISVSFLWTRWGPKLHSELHHFQWSLCGGLQFGFHICRFALVCQLWIYGCPKDDGKNPTNSLNLRSWI